MAYSAQSMYHPAVAPDTGEGMARGIMGLGQGLAGGISQAGANYRSDQRRAEDRQWQVADREAGWAHDDALWNRKTARDDIEYNREKADKDAERKRREDAELNGATGMMAAFLHVPGFMTDAEIAAVGKMDPKAMKGYLAAKGEMLGEFYQNQKRDQERQGKLQSEWQDVTPEGSGTKFYRNNYTGEDRQASPAEGSAQPSMEELRALGFEPKSASVGGVKFERPDPAKRREGAAIYTDRDTFKGFAQLPDNYVLDETGKPVALPPGVDRIAYKEMQARKSKGSAPASSTATGARLKSLIQGIQ